MSINLRPLLCYSNEMIPQGHWFRNIFLLTKFSLLATTNLFSFTSLCHTRNRGSWQITIDCFIADICVTSGCVTWAYCPHPWIAEFMVSMTSMHSWQRNIEDTRLLMSHFIVCFVWISWTCHWLQRIFVTRLQLEFDWEAMAWVKNHGWHSRKNDGRLPW